MGFMVPDVYETDYLEIDGPAGMEIVPCDVADLNMDKERARALEYMNERPIPHEIADYCENRTCYTIERKHGWVGRMSAPGYLDATAWMSGASAREVRASLANLYSDDE